MFNTLLVVSESPRTKLGSNATPKRGPRLIELLRVEVVSDIMSLELSEEVIGNSKCLLPSTPPNIKIRMGSPYPPLPLIPPLLAGVNMNRLIVSVQDTEGHFQLEDL